MKNILLQAAAGTGIGSLVYFTIVIAVIVVLFVVFRNLILWYYKLDVIVSNQQKQIEQNNKIIDQQGIIIDGLVAIKNSVEGKITEGI
ncbi:hypothetical protein EDC17_101125 [Sphingobacterium alimentarium]|uniref:Uncharacterized protein n=1 Tax=Sphingobacterium alimentarium TaxID=797292 RepID=A0A4R3VYV0_9SPHI|nr:hypothetical protein [Sphingobacterium alimentarium]TCV17108.1 hypothetical protein EDC17_101125 [Sphingobacterium alimentarium]